MKIKHFLFLLPLCGLSCLGLISCNSEDAESQPTAGQEGRTYRMVFDADYLGFDAATRASLTWKDGDCVYLTLTDGNATIPGQATYDASTKEWKLYVTKAISATSGSCGAYYFLSPAATSATQLTLSTASVSYTDAEGAYELVEDVLRVTARLMPKTGRLRFKGNPGQSFAVSGLSYYKGFTIATGAFASEPIKISATIGSDGYTEFYHVFYTDDRSLVFDNTETTCWKSSFGTTMLAAGLSGYVTIPTADDPIYWTLVNKENMMPITLPELGAIQLVGNPRSSSATISTSLVSNGNGHISDAGLVYALTSSPSLSDKKVSAAVSAMSSIALTGLTPETTYYVRAFATNEKGTSYGDVLSFTTPQNPEGSDITAGGYDEEHNWDKQ